MEDDRLAWTRWIRVDTMIECYDVSSGVKKELLDLMPDAYEGAEAEPCRGWVG